MKKVLEIDSVLLEFGNKRVLQDVYLNSETGKITGLLGRNGTGKSSIFNILFGEIISHSQSVRIDGNVLLGGKRSPQEIRYLPQRAFVPQHLTIKRVLSDFEVDFANLVSYFPEFQAHYKSRLDHLSSGQRRIVEIFIIVTSSTSFCLLDEPFSQIMPIHINTIKEIILHEKENKGIIVTDHMYRHIIELGDDVYVLNQGKTYLTNSIHDIETLGYARIDDKD